MTENNHNHACIVFSNFQAHGNSVILAEQIVGCGVSLSDSICHEQTKSVSLFEGLVTLTDGHLTIKVVLDTLLTKTPTGDIQIKLGCGVIYRIGIGYKDLPPTTISLVPSRHWTTERLVSCSLPLPSGCLCNNLAGSSCQILPRPTPKHTTLEKMGLWPFTASPSCQRLRQKLV